MKTPNDGYIEVKTPYDGYKKNLCWRALIVYNFVMLSNKQGLIYHNLELILRVCVELLYQELNVQVSGL